MYPNRFVVHGISVSRYFRLATVTVCVNVRKHFQSSILETPIIKTNFFIKDSVACLYLISCNSGLGQQSSSKRENYEENIYAAVGVI